MFDIVWCRCSTLAILLQFVPHLICWSFKLESWDTSASLLLPKEKLNEGHLQQYFHLLLMDVADSFTSNRELHNIRRNKRRCTIWWWMSGLSNGSNGKWWDLVGLGGTWWDLGAVRDPLEMSSHRTKPWSLRKPRKRRNLSHPRSDHVGGLEKNLTKPSLSH